MQKYDNEKINKRRGIVEVNIEFEEEYRERLRLFISDGLLIRVEDDRSKATKIFYLWHPQFDEIEPGEDSPRYLLTERHGALMAKRVK